jgi:DNA-binding NarL/FixJ family response regulator
MAGRIQGALMRESRTSTSSVGVPRLVDRGVLLRLPALIGFGAAFYELLSRYLVITLDVPIVAMTAHTMAGDRQRFLESGMDGYISKPVHSQELVEAIENALSLVLCLEPIRALSTHPSETSDATP